MAFGYRFAFTTRRAGSGTERRDSVRRDIDVTAQIYFQNRQKIVDCEIVDLSDSGALLRPTRVEVLPKFFELRLPSGESFLCEMTRSDEGEIGVRFLR